MKLRERLAATDSKVSLVVEVGFELLSLMPFEDMLETELQRCSQNKDANRKLTLMEVLTPPTVKEFLKAKRPHTTVPIRDVSDHQILPLYLLTAL